MQLALFCSVWYWKPYHIYIYSTLGYHSQIIHPFFSIHSYRGGKQALRLSKLLSFVMNRTPISQSFFSHSVHIPPLFCGAVYTPEEVKGPMHPQVSWLTKICVQVEDQQSYAGHTPPPFWKVSPACYLVKKSWKLSLMFNKSHYLSLRSEATHGDSTEINRLRWTSQF